MKITSIVGAISGYDYSLKNTTDIIYDTMFEIGETIQEINLLEFNLPYCNGTAPNTTVASILNTISDSDGVIFVCTANLFAPSAIMQTFLEYFTMPIYKNILKNKNCMIVVISNTSTKETINYMGNIVNYLGGFDSIKIPITESISRNMSDSTKNIIEKYTEDFYRFVKQERVFFTSSEYKAINSNIVPPVQTVQGEPKTIQKPVFEKIDSTDDDINEISKLISSKFQEQQKSSRPKNKENPFKRQDLPPKTAAYANNANTAYANNANTANRTLYGNVNPYASYQQKTAPPANSYRTKQQQAYVDEYIQKNEPAYNDSYEQKYREPAPAYEEPIQKAPEPQDFSNKYDDEVVFHKSEPEPKINDILNDDLTKADNKARPINCRQKTQNLSHYFKSTMAKGLDATFQLYIDGSEGFNGYLNVYNNQCDYYDGEYSSPSVIIMATDNVWNKVLNGNLTTQRAFMTGQLKVKGNFSLLSKFDMMFK